MYITTIYNNSEERRLSPFLYYEPILFLYYMVPGMNTDVLVWKVGGMTSLTVY